MTNVIESDASEKERDEAQEKTDATASQFDETISVETSVVEGDSVTDTIVEMSAEYDITLIGATREGLFQQLLFDAIPEQVGLRAENTVIMAKRTSYVS